MTVVTSRTEKYAILASRYATVTVPKLQSTIRGSCFSGCMISSMRKFKSAHPSKLHKHAIIAEKKDVTPCVPWNDVCRERFLWNTEESVETNAMATTKRKKTSNSLRDVNSLCNRADSCTPAQFSKVKNIIQETAAIFATGASPGSVCTVFVLSGDANWIPRYTASKYLPNTVAMIACPMLRAIGN